tara:strand:- start:722 stop:907 length:186 start_codon:yes stop_codon:yes gene_type:complete
MRGFFMSMSISEMYQEMIDQYTEMYMYRKAHKDRISEADPHEEILDDLSAIELDMEWTNET